MENKTIIAALNSEFLMDLAALRGRFREFGLGCRKLMEDNLQDVNPKVLTVLEDAYCRMGHAMEVLEGNDTNYFLEGLRLKVGVGEAFEPNIEWLIASIEAVQYDIRIAYSEGVIPHGLGGIPADKSRRLSAIISAYSVLVDVLEILTGKKKQIKPKSNASYSGIVNYSKLN